MCGIVGFFTPDGLADGRQAHDLVVRMRDRLVHRGPDDGGSWTDPAGIAFGFRRLSIIDLSPAGHQPMPSADGRYIVMMNGEVYNFADIRAEVEAVRGPLAWRGHSDTEVMAEAIACWGVEEAIRRANGMFAFAVWDREEQVLTLARDRIGKKPLYYGWAGDAFVFGSELKALWPFPQFDFGISPEALNEFLQLGYVPGERTIFASTFKLPGGALLRLDRQAVRRRQMPRPRPYWDLRQVALAGLDAQASGQTATEEELDAVLRDAVARRMVADVPVGAFLSGGIDSSLVTAVMAAGSASQVRSFSIGFAVKEWNEAEHAQSVASHLGTQHEELYVTPADLIGVVKDLPGILDEPFADDSMIPTTLLCRMARRSVTVALSGDGGDELFAGYARYAAIDRWLSHRAKLPGFGRSLASTLVNSLAGPVGRVSGTRMERRFLLLGSLLDHGDPDRVHEMLVSQSLDPGALLAGGGDASRPLTDGTFNLGRSSAIDRMTFIDTASYLVDDILAKVDRASMSTSLEVRCPLLDYRVIELSWRFPTDAKCRDGVGKLPLRSLLYRHVPQALVDRPKMGFGAPVEVWLQNELRDWAEALMSPEALGRHGLLNVAACRRLWEGFTQHGRGWNRVIWNILMFQAWHEAMQSVEAARSPLVAA
ncbi:asparagine synthase (glutamine-hydrolyzing) [Pseudoroseomonas ludipueritiae]|uniref:asparagine synthase (glutamine-hydrolyzing) n=1 Tax=Pseudoroseomonas ludipueritiae TaxID=198093 RepID=A0ABR7R5Y6_9PROT|nr:asparagine synthase (glutamine-hydrolyzing) [Pseudoroseomonas ludipueritiae]MBC9177153.1 asparagine synthase (glutamine-hydrolyzing) [Pseudoroseomonas ludipueritiae]MCG7359811.1 asparagine synthase (glutamine-hydrolyzing) [Roseomonas sp. ACRSG]